jgi:hypothetical protein
LLPTSASWLKPIEQRWRWLKQTVLHLHRLADDLPALRAQVAASLNRFTPGSPDTAALAFFRFSCQCALGRGLRAAIR